MKIKNIEVGESHQLKTAKKSRESLGKLFSEYEIEEIIENTYNNDDYEDCRFSEQLVVEVDFIDVNDKKFDVKVKNAKGYVAWTNSNCLKKIK